MKCIVCGNEFRAIGNTKTCSLACRAIRCRQIEDRHNAEARSTVRSARYRIPRQCLKCGQQFGAQARFDRVCQTCEAENERMGREYGCTIQGMVAK